MSVATGQGFRALRSAMRLALGVALLAAALGALAPRSAQAGEIFLWTDESGRTHLSDSVPARFRKSALRIDSRQFELSPEQQREAAESRAALDRQASAAAAAASRAMAAASVAAAARRTPTPAGANAAGSAAEGGNADCAKLQREYQESLECFAPFMNANGSLKPGAFAACRSVVNPTLKCGSPKAY